MFSILNVRKGFGEFRNRGWSSDVPMNLTGLLEMESQAGRLPSNSSDSGTESVHRHDHPGDGEIQGNADGDVVGKRQTQGGCQGE